MAKLRKPRSAEGQQITEFAAALAILFFVVFIPLLDLGIMPVRWFLAQELVGTYARKLALCETFSQSLARLAADPSMETKLIQIGGVRPRTLNCSLVISTTRDPVEHYIVTAPKTIPAAWLPNGYRAPCDYQLQVLTIVDISPVFTLQLGGSKIPGLSTPVPFTIAAESNWENLGRDPVTKGYFINE
jgi:hypothetical protein